jgi:hypothetical protein
MKITMIKVSFGKNFGNKKPAEAGFLLPSL